MTTIGELIKSSRKAKGIKMKELSNIIGVSQGHFSNIENNHRNIQRSQLMLICDELGIDVDTALTLSGHNDDDSIKNNEEYLLKIRNATHINLEDIIHNQEISVYFNGEKLYEKELDLISLLLSNLTKVEKRKTERQRYPTMEVLKETLKE